LVDYVLLRLIRLEEKDMEQESRFAVMESKIIQQGKRINQLESKELDKIFSTKSDYSNNKNEGGRDKRPARLVPSTSLLYDGFFTIYIACIK